MYLRFRLLSLLGPVLKIELPINQYLFEGEYYD